MRDGVWEGWSAGKSRQPDNHTHAIPFNGSTPIAPALHHSTPCGPRVFRLAPPRQSAMRDPTMQKSPCSSLFQDIPAFAPGGRGVSNGYFYTAVSARPATIAPVAARGISG